MDYFKLKEILKKYFSIVGFILLVVFGIFIIFANSNSVRAYSLNANQQALLDYYESSLSSSYDSVIILSSNQLIAFNNVPNNRFFFDSFWLSCEYEETISTMLYSCTDGVNINLDSTAIKFGNGSGRYAISNGVNGVVLSSVDIYRGYYHGSDFNQIIFSANYTPVPPFTAPALYPNASSEQSEQEALESGNFTFFVVNPGDVDKNAEILLQFYNTTNFDSGSVVVGEYHLTINSPFFEYTNSAQTEYRYILTARFLDWFQVVNGLSYKAKLSWVNPSNSSVVDSVEYTWTMSLTSVQQQTEQDKTQQEINVGIQNLNNSINETNSFLTNDNFNENTIIDNMPDFSSQLDNLPYDQQLDTLFNSIKNAFISENVIDFEFTIPFSNGQKIIIPSDYISSHLPNIIVNIIQVFYWFIISRYIFKDVWHTIDKMRQGVWFSGSSEDIKTEVL